MLRAAFLWTIAAIVSLSGTPAWANPTYRVLLVGLGAYRSEAFAPLKGAKDMEGLAAVLTQTWKVPNASIEMATIPEKTTKRGILSLIESKLIGPAKPGDIVLFAYSGHGTQVLDPAKPTGLSQAIVPIDVRLMSKDDPARHLLKGDVDPDSLITGPEIGRLFEPLKARGVVNVTLVFDSCHSGSVSRGLCVPKGVENPAVTRFLQAKGTPKPASLVSEGALRGLVAIGAARADQLAWQSERGGNLTVALVEALKHGEGRETYRSLFDRIRTTMAGLPKGAPQDPVLEGDVDRVVMGDSFAAPGSSFPVVFEGGKLSMRAGEVLGIREGYTIGIWPQGTTEFAGDAPWTAVVGATAEGRSELVPTVETARKIKGDLQSLSGTRAILLEPTGEGVLRVHCALQGAKIDPKGLARIPMISLESAPDAYDVRLGYSAGRYVLTDPSGQELDTVAEGGTVAEVTNRVRGALESLARKSAVLALGPSEKPDVDVEMQIVGATLDHPDDLDRALVSEIDAGTIEPGSVVGAGRFFAIRVRARGRPGSDGDYDPYVALLTINPHPEGEGKHVQQLWPDAKGAGGNVEQRRLRADGTYRYLGVDGSLVDGKDPKAVAWFGQDPTLDGVGDETWKVFATRQPEDFSPLVDVASAKGASPKSRLGTILAGFSSLQPVGRGQSVRKRSNAQWTTAQITLRTR